MKKLFALAILVLISGITTLVSCKKDTFSTNEKVESPTENPNANKFAIDIENSNINWKGYKLFKSEISNHFGIMRFSKGEIGIDKGNLVSGKFIADVSSLKTTDIEDAKSAEKLDNHLKNVDFFDTENHPTATFEITKVIAVNQGDYNTSLEGNLTIKGITKKISLNANVKINENQISIATQPTDIKREDFNVKFQSPIENGIIKNEITIQAIIKASLTKK